MAMKRPKVKVHVTKYKGEKNLVMRYIDPVTGRQKRKSADTVDDMKGRALNETEFHAMLNAVPKVVGDDLADDWKLYLHGLWFSGLRRQESLILSWDEYAPFAVDMTGLFPRFRITGRAQKSH